MNSNNNTNNNTKLACSFGPSCSKMRDWCKHNNDVKHIDFSKICLYNIKGNCRNGDHCNYIHCQVLCGNLNCKNPKCLYLHSLPSNTLAPAVIYNNNDNNSNTLQSYPQEDEDFEYEGADFIESNEFEDSIYDLINILAKQFFEGQIDLANLIDQLNNIEYVENFIWGNVDLVEELRRLDVKI